MEQYSVLEPTTYLQMNQFKQTYVNYKFDYCVEQHNFKMENSNTNSGY